MTSHPARPYYAICFPVAGVGRQNAPRCQISHIGCVIADLSCSLEGGWSRRIPMCTCGRLERSQVLDMKACLLSLLGFPASVTTHVCVDCWPCPVVLFRHSKTDPSSAYANLRASLRAFIIFTMKTDQTVESKATNSSDGSQSPTTDPPRRTYSMKDHWKCLAACTLVSMCPFQYGRFSQAPRLSSTK